MKEVINSFITAVSDKVTNYLKAITVDNTGIARRGKLSDRIESKVIPEVRKLIRTTKLPADLSKLESKYVERVLWPKSCYNYKDMMETLAKFERQLVYPKWFKDEGKTYSSYRSYTDWWDEHGYKIPWKRSSSFSFDTTGLDLSKGAGLPAMGPKRLQLTPAKAYAEKIKQDQSTPAYAILPGFRTQMAEPGTTKSRPIWGDPISEWVLEVEACQSAIKNTVQHAQSNSKDVQVLYCDPQTAHKYIFDIDWRSCVVLDSTTFDASVSAWELDQGLRYMAGDYVAIDHVVDHAIRAPLVLADRILQRFGGMPSGKVFTNYVDGMANMIDVDHAITRLKLDQFAKGWLVNGDDIAILFNTLTTEKNVKDICSRSTREMNPDKGWMSTDGVWFSKVLYLPEFWCKPAFLVLNSIMFSENMADPLTGTREYVAVVVAQQVEYLRFHPLGEKICKMIKKVDKYPIDTIDDSRLKPALALYASKHNWMEETGQMDAIAKLPETSFYASV